MVFHCLVYMSIYTTAMNHSPTPQTLLQEIAKIQQMEPGKLCVIRHGPQGPYYNLQCREQGRTVTRYVPADQVPVVATHTANYQRFQTLVEQYAHQEVERTRADRTRAAKKKSRRLTSTWRKRKKSSS